ncbi:Chloride transport protein [Oopsacas minuta]|uniref:Chloride transport protein n=1 Tax=Oopsacas minuta TaxID=111878 RepID=A0AAV7KGZ7_9METZ|nr:Chloride transport protein [Oopsacas minuta]
MQSLLNSSDSRTFQSKYQRIEDVDSQPQARPPYFLPNLRFSSLRRRNSEQKKPQSLDYSVCYNAPYRDYVERNATKRYLGVSRDIWHSVASWVIVGIIGILTGVVAFLINLIIKYLNQLRYGSMLSVFYQYFEMGYLILAFLTLLAFNCLFVLIAALLTGFEPLAAGSGIPEIKCYLNGIKVPHVVRLRTLIIKATGVLFSVAGGLLVGKEGPMIHSGAIIGAGVPQFRTFAVPRSLRERKLFNFPLTMFRNDKDKRDFVSCGAAAGVAAAFGSPIGGVLFALEEGCSFWNQSLTWKALFCSMCAFFGLNMLSGLAISDTQKDVLSTKHVITLIGEGLISFGTFPQNQNLWTAKDLLIFSLMGFGGGILGATFNALNKKLTIYRFKFMHRFVILSFVNRIYCQLQLYRSSRDCDNSFDISGVL